MAIIKEEVNKEMFDVGEMVRDYGSDDCCPSIETDSTPKKMKKSYPTFYMYEIPDTLFSSFTPGQEVTLTMKCKVKETTERVRNTEEKGESIKRTVDLEVHEVSKPE